MTTTKGSKNVAAILIYFAVAVVLYVVVPGTSRAYTISVLNGALIYYVACLGSSVMLGMCGMVSFAATAFMGVGGYASALLSKVYGINSMVSMMLALLITMVLSLIIGLVLMRLNGTFFTFSTVALVQISFSIFNNWKSVTGGPNGLNAIPPFEMFGFRSDSFLKNYFVLITICVICALLVLRLRNTTLGREMSSVRDNELAAKIMGVNVYQTKVIAFVISAMFAGLAGAMMVHNNHFVVSTYFTFDISTTLIIMIMLGGVNNPIGVFLGTILITILPEWLRPLQEYIRLVYGLGVMLLMVFMPMGLWGTFVSIANRIKRRFKLGHKTKIGRAAAREE
ncbi:MAG: branched-chain amino acid ABC transporter permease [Oscillospiraceae bacterium]